MSLAKQMADLVSKMDKASDVLMLRAKDRLARRKKAAGSYDESKHPRGQGGRWSSSGGGGQSIETSASNIREGRRAISDIFGRIDAERARTQQAISNRTNFARWLRGRGDSRST